MSVKRYVELINMGGDYCGMGLASEWPKDEWEDCDTSRANDDEWVLASDHDATVIEQQREIERLRAKMLELLEMLDYDKGSERYSAAVAAAYEEIDK